MENNLSGILTIFIMILVGLTLLIPLSSSNENLRSIGLANNDTVTLTQNTFSSLTYDDLISVTALKNASGSTLPTSNYTVNLAAGTINTTTSTGTYYANYSYYPDTYVKDSSSRALANLIILFFILGLIATALFLIKKTGLLDGKL